MNLSRLFTVQLSMFFVVFSNSDMLSHSGAFVNNFFIFLFSFLKLMCCRFLTTLIFYQIVFCLSRTFSFFISNVPVLCDSLIILSNHSSFVNNFSQKNSNNSYFKSERRKRDLNPRAGYPTYTLSRGTSSAT